MMQTQSLFEDLVIEAPPTEGIKYTGSKFKLLPYILQLARRVKATTVFDGFSGTTRVSQAFAKLGYKVYSNDIAVWSEVLGSCYLLAQKTRNAYIDLISHLNHVLNRKRGNPKLNSVYHDATNTSIGLHETTSSFVCPLKRPIPA